MRMMPTLNIQDPTVQKILPLYQEAVAQEALLLNSGLGRKPSESESACARTQEVYTKQLEGQVAIIRSGLAEESEERARRHVTNCASASMKSTQRQLDQKNLSATYTRAKNTYIKEKTLLDSVRTRAQSQTMELAMPRMAVSVKQVAEPPSYPGSSARRT